MKHTPGPWKFTETKGDRDGKHPEHCRQWVISSANRALMALLEVWKFEYDHEGFKEVRSNARLMAAAPELLAALAACHDVLLMDPRYEQGRARLMAEKAIAKAKGD